MLLFGINNYLNKMNNKYFLNHMQGYISVVLEKEEGRGERERERMCERAILIGCLLCASCLGIKPRA